MFQEPSQDGTHPDVLAQSFHAGPDGADAPHPHVHFHSRPGSAVEGVDDGLVDDGVHLDADSRRQTRGVVGDFGFDAFQQAAADSVWGDEQSAVLGLVGDSGQVVEQARHVVGDDRIGGQQSHVLVAAGGLGMVIAGAHVGVAAQPSGFLTHYQGQLAVGFQPDHAVDDVHPRLLQLPGPGDVVLLVETSLDLHHGEHLFSRLGGLNEGVDDGGVAGGSI